MSVDLYERYKDALRRGHMAVARGQLEAALAAYREALALAPNRVLPHVGLGQVLLRQGAAHEALEAFDAALARSPRDEAGLRGRAETLATLGRRTDAADAFDILSDVQETAARLGDARDTTRRALDMAEQKARRRRLQDLTRRLPPAADERSPEPSAAEDLSGPGEPAPPEPAAPSVPAPDPVALIEQGEAALDAGDIAAARESYLAAAAAFDADGRVTAALDACYVAIAFAPDDADVHLQLVELYLEAGWNGPAADKLALLGRLTELDGGPVHARARIVGLAADHFPDDSRLRGLSAQGAAPG